LGINPCADVLTFAVVTSDSERAASVMPVMIWFVMPLTVCERSPTATAASATAAKSQRLTG
jgi:hypothetical protein